MLNNLKSQRGGSLLILVILSLLLISTFMTFKIVNKAQQKRLVKKKKEVILKKKGCEIAMKKIIEAIEEEKLTTGKYPYVLDYDFMDRHEDLDRFVFNSELWTDESENTVDLDTMFGTEYTLTGECQDGKDYVYSSLDKTFVNTRRNPANMQAQ